MGLIADIDSYRKEKLSAELAEKWWDILFRKYS